MKKYSTIILILIISVITALPCYADIKDPRLVDSAGLLDSYERANVTEKLDTLSDRLQFDIVILTVDSIGYKTPREYADDYYDSHSYGYGSEYDGILMLVSMQERDWYITTCGYGIYAFTDAGLNYIEDEIVYYLSEGSYEDAFLTFADTCERFVLKAREGSPYDYNDMPKEPFNFFFNLVVCLIIGLIAALITTSIMKGKLKSVRSKSRAEEYVRKGSLNITSSSDLFLYRTVHRRPRPKDNSSSGGSSSHRSSSGRSHGGRGGKF